MIKTHCPAGHEFTDENVYVWTDRHGRCHRHCRACRRAAVARCRARAREGVPQPAAERRCA